MLSVVTVTKKHYWEGISPSGALLQGACNLKPSDHIEDHLPNDITLTKYKKKIHIHLLSRQKITRKDITNLTHRLSILLSRHLPLDKALGLLAQQYQNKPLYDVIDKLRLSINQGQAFSAALAQHPRLFNAAYRAMIHAGEASGKLIDVLQKLSTSYQKRAHLRQQYQKVLIYPTFVLAISLCITAGLLCLVLPQFQSLFQELNGTLPRLTQIILLTSDLIRHYSYWGIATGLCMITLTLRLYRKLPTLKLWTEIQIRKIPVLNQFIMLHTCTHFIGTLALTLQSGIPLSTAWPIAKKTVKNIAIINDLSIAEQMISQGASLSTALSSIDLLTPESISILSLSEASGDLDNTLTLIAETAEDALAHKLDVLSKWLEPLIMLWVACITGIILIGMYLPIFQIGLLV